MKYQLLKHIKRLSQGTEKKGPSQLNTIGKSSTPKMNCISQKIISTTIVQGGAEVICDEIRNCWRDGGSWNNPTRVADNSVTVINVEIPQVVHGNTRSEKLDRSQG